ncbi:MAG: hypothetical protein ACMG5Z_08325 [Luteimonas sp.]
MNGFASTELDMGAPDFCGLLAQPASGLGECLDAAGIDGSLEPHACDDGDAQPR